MLKIADITIAKLRANKLEKELPEFYELKSVIENNAWHNESTFDHTLNVLEELQKILQKTNKKINSYLNSKVNKNTRKELLFLATMLHDIAKKETIVKDGDISSFPKHEELGSKKAEKILNKFDLSAREKELVLEIIKNHGVIHLSMDLKDSALHEELLKIKEDYKEIFLEIVLLTMADTLGCQLKEKNPENFRFRINVYQNILDNY